MIDVIIPFHRLSFQAHSFGGGALYMGRALMDSLCRKSLLIISPYQFDQSIAINQLELLRKIRRKLKKLQLVKYTLDGWFSINWSFPIVYSDH